MIKKTYEEILIEKVDRLTAVVEKFVAKHQEPMRKLVVRDENAAPKRTYTKRLTTKRSSKRGAVIPPETYQAIRALRVGDKVNMTSWMRTNSVSLQQLKDRIYSFMWKNRKDGNDNRYVVVRDSLEVFIERVA